MPGPATPVTSISRAFFLGPGYRPGRAFVAAPLDVTLTAASPAASLFTAGGGR